MAWRKWKKEDEDLPVGTSVKIDKHFGNLSDKVGKVEDTAAAASFSIVKIAGKRHSFHNSDLFIKTEVFGESVNPSKTKQFSNLASQHLYDLLEHEKPFIAIERWGDLPWVKRELSIEQIKTLKKLAMDKLGTTNNNHIKQIIRNTIIKLLGENKIIQSKEIKLRKAIRKEIKSLLKETKISYR